MGILTLSAFLPIFSFNQIISTKESLTFNPASKSGLRISTKFKSKPAQLFLIKILLIHYKKPTYHMVWSLNSLLIVRTNTFIGYLQQNSSQTFSALQWDAKSWLWSRNGVRTWRGWLIMSIQITQLSSTNWWAHSWTKVSPITAKYGIWSIRNTMIDTLLISKWIQSSLDTFFHPFPSSWASTLTFSYSSCKSAITSSTNNMSFHLRQSAPTNQSLLSTQIKICANRIR